MKIKNPIPENIIARMETREFDSFVFRGGMVASFEGAADFVEEGLAGFVGEAAAGFEGEAAAGFEGGEGLGGGVGLPLI